MDFSECTISSTNGHYVFLREIAVQIGMDRTHVRTYARRHGFVFSKQRDPSKGNALALVLPVDEVQRLLALRQSQGFPLGKSSVVTPIVPVEVGIFYLIQLVPDLSPLRLKLGFTDSLPRRLTDYLTSNPTAEVFHTWSCRRVWEPAAIASVTRTGCRCIGGEVYDCEDLQAMKQRCEAFFALMPIP